MKQNKTDHIWRAYPSLSSGVATGLEISLEPSFVANVRHIYYIYTNSTELEFRLSYLVRLD